MMHLPEQCRVSTHTHTLRSRPVSIQQMRRHLRPSLVRVYCYLNVSICLNLMTFPKDLYGGGTLTIVLHRHPLEWL